MAHAALVEPQSGPERAKLDALLSGASAPGLSPAPAPSGHVELMQVMDRFAGQK